MSPRARFGSLAPSASAPVGPWRPRGRPTRAAPVAARPADSGTTHKHSDDAGGAAAARGLGRAAPATWTGRARCLARAAAATQDESAQAPQTAPAAHRSDRERDASARPSRRSPGPMPRPCRPSQRQVHASQRPRASGGGASDEKIARCASKRGAGLEPPPEGARTIRGANMSPRARFGSLAPSASALVGPWRPRGHPTRAAPVAARPADSGTTHKHSGDAGGAAVARGLGRVAPAAQIGGLMPDPSGSGHSG